MQILIFYKYKKIRNSQSRSRIVFKNEGDAGKPQCIPKAVGELDLILSGER